MKKKIYLLGIGGIAMANLACLLKEQGYFVSGSDIDTFGPSAELLMKHRIKYFKDHNPSHIKTFEPDMVVIGNAMNRGNPSLEYILNEQIPHQSMPEAIRNYVIENKKSIVIAGTSGKTTTTAITAWILKFAGLNPRALIGGTAKNFNSGFINRNGKFVVTEGDEYNSSFYDLNPKFTHYRPYHAIITNIQSDHLDIYGNIDNIFKAFQKLAKLIPSSGSLTLNARNGYTPELSKESATKIITFGRNGNIEARNIKYAPEGISFDLLKNKKRLGLIKSPLLGDHNIENILASISVALNIKIPFSKISKALTEFKGVKRRLEIIHQKDNLTIIDDFAHNPDKVSASLSALKKHFPKHKIIAIFEPRTASSRRKFFQNAYISSFKSADTVYIAEPYKKSALKKEEVFSSKKLVKDLNKKDITAYSLENADSIVAHIGNNLALKTNKLTPKVFCIMTSGEFDGIHQKLISVFK